jgi:hypothetical protein
VRTVADCGHYTCVANVAALIKNREEGGPNWTAKSIQDKYGPVGTPNDSAVPSVAKALAYLGKATGRLYSVKGVFHFQEAQTPGDYAIFLNNRSHVVYGVVESGPGGRVLSILDANVGRGWEGWQAFAEHCATTPLLYGSMSFELGNWTYFLRTR